MQIDTDCSEQLPTPCAGTNNERVRGSFSLFQFEGVESLPGLAQSFCPNAETKIDAARTLKHLFQPDREQMRVGNSVAPGVDGGNEVLSHVGERGFDIDCRIRMQNLRFAAVRLLQRDRGLGVMQLFWRTQKYKLAGRLIRELERQPAV